MPPPRLSFLVALSAILSLTGPARAETPYTPQELSLMRAFFQTMQPRSFELNAELCGYILRDDAGHLRITGPILGDAASCGAPWPTWGVVIASWHTHGAFNPDAYNELPSDVDVETDVEEGIDGWVATPGGRLWHVNGQTETIDLICGQGCLPADPDYDPSQTGEIAKRYTYEELLDRLGE